MTTCRSIFLRMFAVVLTIALNTSLPQKVHAQSEEHATHQAASQGNDLLPRAIQNADALATWLDGSVNTTYRSFLNAVQTLAFTMPQNANAQAVKASCESATSGLATYMKASEARGDDWPAAQDEASMLIRMAIACDSLPLYEYALRSTSRALIHMRQTLATPSFSRALMQLSLRDTTSVFYKTDPRLLIPYFESLMSLKDFASLERITSEILKRNPDVARDRIEHYHKVASQAPTVRLVVNAPDDCVPLLNHTTVQDDAIELRTGRYEIGCQDQSSQFVRYTTTNTTMFSTP